MKHRILISVIYIYTRLQEIEVIIENWVLGILRKSLLKVEQLRKLNMQI